ncbi:MAG: FAD-binding oxidoreductase [Sandaracinaceae bacterium]
MTTAPSVHDRALLELDRGLRSGAVSTEVDRCDAYARDESEAQPIRPSAVIRVERTAEVAHVMRVAHRHGVYVTPRAGGTGRSGGAVPVRGGWVLAFERFDALKEIDRGDDVAVVEPGVVLGDLHAAVEAEGLFYGPDPNSWASCTVGGNIAENAGGPRAFKYGVTRDWVLGLEVVLPDGTVLEMGRRTRKGVTGYDLTALMVGSEGTLGLVTRATLRLAAKPEAIRTLLVFVDDEGQVGPMVSAIRDARVQPRCVELLDAITLSVLREKGAGVQVPRTAKAMLLIELDGSETTVESDLDRLGNVFDDGGALDVQIAKHGGDRERLWAVRRQMSRSLRERAKHKLSEDVVVPRSQIGVLLAACRGISEAHGIVMPTYGHAGDGNLHVNFLWNDDAEKPRVDAAIEALFRETIRLRGTLSGEHGIGALKAPYLALEQSAALIDLQRGIKARFDPTGILNPGKIFAPTRGHGAC